MCICKRVCKSWAEGAGVVGYARLSGSRNVGQSEKRAEEVRIELKLEMHYRLCLHWHRMVNESCL